MEGGSRSYLAKVLLDLGHLDDARSEAKRALELLQTSPTAIPLAHAVLARVERHAGDLSAARREIELAMRGIDAAEEGEAIVRLEHAEVLFALGETHAARAAIVAARDRLLARAARISDASMRERFLSRVAENARTLELATAWCRGE